MRLSELILGLIAVVSTASAPDEKKSMTPEEFDRLHDLVRPRHEFSVHGESAYLDDIDWEKSIQKARERSVAENKPILICQGKPTWLGLT